MVLQRDIHLNRFSLSNSGNVLQGYKNPMESPGKLERCNVSTVNPGPPC